jgi:streptogramin lyase
MGTQLDRVFLLLAVGGALALPASATAAPAIPPPQAPQNPYFAANPNNNIHNDTWMTDAYARGGPTATNPVTNAGTQPPSLCGSLTFDKQGRIVTVCPSTVAAPQLRLVDPNSLAMLASFNLPAGGPPPPNTPAFQNFTGGGYFFLDNKDQVWSATKTNHLFVLGETGGGTGFKLVKDYDLTKAVTGNERITSALRDFNGLVWFVSKADGKVGTLDPKTGTVKVFKTGEEIENSFAIGKDGVYIVSDKRMYKFTANKKGKPQIAWQVKYKNSGIHKPSQVDAGSGTTPTIMQKGLVAITDNADPMNVVVYRTATKLKQGQKRVVCETPVFGKGGSATENSLIGSGRSLIVEDNYGYVDPFDPSTGGALTTPGFARVDVNKNLTGCKKVWTNNAVAAPSVVPKLSTKTGLVYTYSQTAGLGAADRQWSWVGINARTGKTAFTVPAGTGLLANNNYAGIALGPKGTAYLGTIGGIRSLRG